MKTSQYYYATGKRKCAIARVKLHESGTGEVVVNNQKLKSYFSGIQPEKVISPLTLTNHKNVFDVTIEVLGGGKDAQSEAARHGSSRALTLFDPKLRPSLKKAGYLRRDARTRERKKPGLKRARRAPQWAKR